MSEVRRCLLLAVQCIGHSHEVGKTCQDLSVTHTSAESNGILYEDPGRQAWLRLVWWSADVEIFLLLLQIHKCIYCLCCILCVHFRVLLGPKTLIEGFYCGKESFQDGRQTGNLKSHQTQVILNHKSLVSREFRGEALSPFITKLKSS